jgi:aconitate hydratase
MSNSYGSQSTLEVGGREYEIHRLDALQETFDVARLPYSIKVLLENVLRLEDGESVTAADVETIAKWDAKADPSEEIPFQPARVLMQDFTGVPAVVDLAAMRDAMDELGADATKINPLVPVDLVIDHSVQVDAFGNARAFAINAGARRPSTTSASSRPRPASATRSTSSTWAASSGAATPTARSAPIPTRSSAPTRTRR